MNQKNFIYKLLSFSDKFPKKKVGAAELLLSTAVETFHLPLGP